MITLKQWMEGLNKLVQKHPEIGDYPLIYSTDDEGNSFYKVVSEPTLAQVSNMKKHDIVVNGFAGEIDIDDKDCNAICIN